MRARTPRASSWARRFLASFDLPEEGSPLMKTTVPGVGTEEGGIDEVMHSSSPFNGRANPPAFSAW
jgi:hypothetical protein